MLTGATTAIEPVEADHEDDAWYARWRRQELARVDRAGLCYLDYAGAALHPASLVRADGDRLEGGVLGNPHSEHRASLAATNDIESARRAILDFLHADPDEYGVVLTANASAACRLVGESYPWRPSTAFVLAADNHNSVNGIGEFAWRGGAGVRSIRLGRDLRLADPEEVLAAHAGAGLFAFPAQSNFSGVRHPLELIETAHGHGLDVLLDAASFLSSSDLDLRVIRPDFLVLSVYKIAGYPAGVGALVARRSALDRLERPWFAGGTVDWVAPGLGRHQLRRGVERFEDGTPAFLVAGAVAPALAAVAASDRVRLRRHLDRLTRRLLEGLDAIRHDDGRPAIRIHGPRGTEGRGPIVAFTIEDNQGNPVPFWTVEESARDAGVAVRGGCFCNPGCAEQAFGLHPALIQPCLEALGDHFSIPLLAECLGGGPVGAIRISLGLGSIQADVDRALALLERYGGRAHAR